MNVVLLCDVERAPLGPPCEVCADRTHTRHYHGELCQLGDEALTAEEVRLRGVRP